MENDDAHNLMPTDVGKDIPPLDATADESDPTAWVKYFTPWSNWTWFVIEFDRGNELCHGFVIGHEAEFGGFSLDELREIRGRGGIRIERDLNFMPEPISAIREKYGV